jgi:hypothetical protein
LDVAIAALIVVGEILQEKRDVANPQIAAPTQLAGDMFGNYSDHRSAVLKAMTRIGLLYWPESMFWMTGSRSVVS